MVDVRVSISKNKIIVKYILRSNIILRLDFNKLSRPYERK